MLARFNSIFSSNPDELRPLVEQGSHTSVRTGTERKNHKVFGVNDLVCEIAKHIKSPTDLLSLSLVSKKINDYFNTGSFTKTDFIIRNGNKTYIGNFPELKPLIIKHVKQSNTLKNRIKSRSNTLFCANTDTLEDVRNMSCRASDDVFPLAMQGFGAALPCEVLTIIGIGCVVNCSESCCVIPTVVITAIAWGSVATLGATAGACMVSPLVIAPMVSNNRVRKELIREMEELDRIQASVQLEGPVGYSMKK